jgi:hypothetical protein
MFSFQREGRRLLAALGHSQGLRAGVGRGAMSRLGRPHVGLKLPFVNYWNAYCKRIDAAWPFSGQPSPGETMKIYMLMVLIGAIAAMSHLDFKRKSPERGT